MSWSGPPVYVFPLARWLREIDLSLKGKSPSAFKLAGFDVAGQFVDADGVITQKKTGRMATAEGAIALASLAERNGWRNCTIAAALKDK